MNIEVWCLILGGEHRDNLRTVRRGEYMEVDECMRNTDVAYRSHVLILPYMFNEGQCSSLSYNRFLLWVE